MIKRSVLTIVSLLLTQNLTAIDITVIIKGVKVNDGNILVGLFNDPGEFPNGRQKKGQLTDSETDTVRVIFTDLPDGKYAVVAFQDKNSNEKLDMNFLGIPTERYGFSGRKVLGQPDFEDSAIDLNSNVKKIIVEIE